MSPRSKARSGLLASALVVLGVLLFAAAASADYEQVPEHFGVDGEAEQLQNSLGMAINEDGAGGVAPGSLYVVGRNSRVVRFAPGGEGEEPAFREAWGWGIAAGGPGEGYVRCGPAYKGVANPAEGTYEHCKSAPAGAPFGGEEVGHFETPSGVAIDQSNGNVYVLNQYFRRKHHLIEVFTPRGVPIGEGFGDAGRETPAPAETIAEGPSKIHRRGPETTAIAVDENGTVYLNDFEYESSVEPRVMSFEPCEANQYENYCYTGREDDMVFPNGEESTRLALVGGDRLAVASGEWVRLYPRQGGSPAPLCNLAVSGQLQGMAANPVTGEVFYSAFASRSITRLRSCNEASGKFEALQTIKPAPVAEGMSAMAVNPTLSWGPSRQPGALYTAESLRHGEQKGLGYVLAPAKIFPPLVESQTVADASTHSATLRAQVDPRGFPTTYTFQYLTQAAYEANEPDERQSLAVSAGGGLFGLGFEGQSLGREATADLTNGSRLAKNLVTARGAATLHAASGSADLHGAQGTGTVIAGSKTVTAASATQGAFAVGQTIRGEGIPAGATISAIAGSEITLSAEAAKSVANTPLRAGTATLTSLATSEGAFEAGQEIKGPGIPAGATIVSVSGSELTLSTGVEGPGTAVEVKAGSKLLTGLSVSEGEFIPGQAIAGEGIPPKTTIEAVHSSSLEISAAVSKPGAAVAISSSGPAPLAVGETVEGPGLAPGTKIAATEAGQLTLSQPAEATASGVQLLAGLPFDASALEVRRGLEGLTTIGTGNVSVSGGPGDPSGSHPYEIVFGGRLSNQDLPQLQADSSGLSGGSAQATVATAHNGGGGFAGAAEAPPTPGSIAAGSVATAAAAIAGLAPDTSYRFRVLATSPCEGEEGDPCVTKGEAAAFATYPASLAVPPDDRAYELVSPTQKNGGEVFPADPRVGSCEGECKPPGGATATTYPMQVAPGGDGVTYMGYPFSPTEGSAVWNSYLSRRTATGWQTTALSPTLLSTGGGEDLSFDAQLGAGAILQDSPPLTATAVAGYSNLYLQDTASPAALTPLLTSPPPHRAPGSMELRYAGASPDYSCQFFSLNDALTPATAYAPEPPDPTSLGRDLYQWCGDDLTLVNVLPGNASVAAEPLFASPSPDAHGVSADGRRVFWEAGGTIYVREDGKVTREVTQPGTFLVASQDGLEVLLSSGCLYSLATEACSDLTQGEGGFKGVAGSAGDLSRIYFVDTAALAGSGPNERGQVAEEGAPNLYLYRQGAGTSFIATLAPSDGNGVAPNSLEDWADEPVRRTAEASPGGRFLAFGSTLQLTGYDNVGSCPKNSTVQVPCAEVFLYDSGTGQLTCPSCNPTGEAPLGNSTLRRIAGERPWQSQPRYLTDSGRLYFDSQDRLSPRDVNGKVEDVYELEPNGSGSCARALGCVSLVSPGTGSSDSNFLAMDESGANVFFTSRERLVQKDTDQLVDLYDAREGGGFPGETETQSPECQGESCQPTPSPPSEQTPASLQFNGPGNVKEASAPPHCAKGKVRKKGKCVKKHGKRHKAHKRKGQKRGSAKGKRPANSNGRAHR